MHIYTFRSFPCTSTMLRGDGVCRRMGEGEHFIRIIGARLINPTALRGLVYGFGMVTGEIVSFVVTKSQRSLDLWRVIETATFGSVLRVSVGAEDYVEFGTLVWLDSRTTHETQMPVPDKLKELPPEAFRAMQHAAAIGNGPTATIPFIMEDRAFFDCFRIVVVGLNPPVEMPAADFLKQTVVLKSFTRWFGLVEQNRCGHIFDADYPSPTALEKRLRNADPIAPLAVSETGFPGLTGFFSSLTLDTGKKVDVQVAQAWLSALPSRQGERTPVGFGDSVRERTARRDFLALLGLYQPDLVIFSGRITTRRAPHILKPLLRDERSRLSGLRHERKGVEQSGFPSVSLRLWKYNSTVFMAAPDLRFFNLPDVQRREVGIGFWDEFREQVLHIVRAELSRSPVRISAGAEMTIDPPKLPESVASIPTEPPASPPAEPVVPAAPSGSSINIGSAPPSAEISILGLPVMLTPATYHLTPGTFKGTIRHDGYRDQDICLTVGNKSELFYFELVPVRGLIEIVGAHPTQHFRLTGCPLFPAAEKPFVVPDLEFGAHVLEVFEKGASSPVFRCECVLSIERPVVTIQLVQASAPTSSNTSNYKTYQHEGGRS